jgi:hypothetical protein
LQWAPENRSQRADPEGWRGWLSAWKEYGIAVDEYRELDEERGLVLVHQHGRGKTSGLEGFIPPLIAPLLDCAKSRRLSLPATPR